MEERRGGSVEVGVAERLGVRLVAALWGADDGTRASASEDTDDVGGSAAAAAAAAAAKIRRLTGVKRRFTPEEEVAAAAADDGGAASEALLPMADEAFRWDEERWLSSTE